MCGAECGRLFRRHKPVVQHDQAKLGLCLIFVAKFRLKQVLQLF